MRLVIKPQENRFNLIVEAEAYRQIWKQHARKLRKAFREISGLDFNQAVITAHVYDGQRSLSGYYRHPMRLQADGKSHEDKLLILVHELSHRLLGGNTLALNSELNLSNLELHKRIYLFLYDVVNQALGAEMVKRLAKLEARPDDPDYYKAWKWAIAMAFEQRQSKMKQLAKQAKPYRNIVVK
ncbi:MAG: hypothetical protein ACREGG_03965 [Candidatus Saccharimonadales bacterium]